jgi:4,5:9,10-diseco-3-hydroxy-5,9,17-trioxoandrosta-1(10),2-diene-4-oate hydrolase
MARILLALVIIVVLAVAAGAFAVWRYPLEIADALARRSLKQAGLARAALSTPHGALSYWAGGAGDATVILLHGGADEGSTWAKTVPVLTGRHRVVVPDLPGHGESEPTQGPLPVGLIVESIGALVEQEAARGPVTIVGNSLGGWAALHLALLKPERVGRLVLEDAGGMLWLEPVVANFQPKDRAATLAMFKATTGPDTSVPAGFILDRLGERLREGPMSRLLQASVVEFLLLDQLAQVRQRADLIWGDHDQTLPLKYAEAMAKRLPNAELHVIARAGHVPHREKPREFNELLQKILSAP